MRNIKFTVITVCYNSEKTIQRTLQSIKDQTYKNIEYIIIDGGSTDKTLEIISNYKDIIDILISELDNGIYDAMNKGIRLATGNYIGFLNSDDYYADNIFEEYNKALIKKSYDFIYSDSVFFNDKQSWISKGIDFGTKKFFKHLNNYQPFCHQTLYIKRDVYNYLGFFDDDFRIAADYDFFLRLVNSHKNYKGYYLNILGCYFSIIDGASSNFIKARLEDIKCRTNNGYSMINSLYIFLKLCFFYYLQKIPFMKKVKHLIKRQEMVKYQNKDN
ncbi:glycosyltransferase family 2 protein [Francisella philomiragia]|uniref:glycosyltransferase family 2 protein n=1 Tax=Francisella philomiragia TaxID=28110 RepID=UPI001F2E0CB0|nr:glycosyltransferase family 2 protein [Francisella philomiragia]